VQEFRPALVFMSKRSPNLFPTHLALLRGINVSGKNKLLMKDLIKMFVQTGCDNVRSYIQSGNIIFTAAPALSTQIPALITAKIAHRFGYQIPVVMRTAKELDAIVRNNPFLKAGAPEETLHVMFLADLPSPSSVAALDANRSSGDAFLARGQEVYLQLPNGVANGKLTNAWFDAKLATTSTARNWRTVVKLFALRED
jgi:uncharacterized protein (DUF1697 family)